MNICSALKPICTKTNKVRKHKMKTILLIAVMAFSINAFSQKVPDFKPEEVYRMLGQHPDNCIQKLKAKDFEYLFSKGSANAYTPKGDAAKLVGNVMVLNYDKGSNSVDIIVYSTLDYSFVSSLRVFMQVGFYAADDVGDARVWQNAKGTSKIFLSQTKTEAGLDQYNVAFKNVVR